MTGNLIRRLATVATAALLGSLLLGTGAATAQTPTWDITVVKLPPTVTSGKDAGYRVTVWNNGTSNINTLTFSSSIADPVTFYSGSLVYSASGTGTCSTSGSFTCDIGTLNAHSNVTFTIAYKTSGTGTFDVTFSIQSASGNTGDPKHNSRGDALSKTFQTGLNSGDFAGGYFQADELLQTNPTLGKKNKQSTSLIGFSGASTIKPYDVMISDGTTSFPTALDDPNTGLTCGTDSHCTGLLGEWSFVNLKEGKTQGTAFHVTMILDGSYIPGGTLLSDLVLVHVYYDDSAPPVSTTEVISLRCADANTPAASPNACIFLTKIGSNVKVDAWLYHNGGVRLQ